ncbi:MAG: DUF1761 domain-containing protein [Rhodospirillaceae bacterium]|nr:DUF1761 domain-containing protein [Rhodospirillaceae bacterium]
MILQGVNWVGVVAAMVAAMVVGSLWYSPLLFMKRWIKEIGKTPEQLGKPMLAVGNSVAMYLIAAIGLSVVFDWKGVATLGDALVTAAAIWFAFVGSMELMHDRYNGASAMLSVINCGNTFVSFLAMGAVIHGLG